MSEPIEVIEILDLIPHRYPFLLVDRVTEHVPFESLVAIKNVSMNEPCFQGHFPGQPIMPGVLILEALAQACAILCSKSKEASEGMKFIYFFGGIDKARFKKQVIPGDVLTLKVSVIKNRREIWKMHTEAYVGEDLVCQAELISACKEVPKES
jgi:3-hydroxyacyl-[acyl-carrier-protein] dehydratase